MRTVDVASSGRAPSRADQSDPRERVALRRTDNAATG